MTRPDVARRLGWLAHRARGLADVTYEAAFAAADATDVIAADAQSAAISLANRFRDLADSLQTMDVDSRTLGEAMDLADAELRVASAARAAENAAAELDRARRLFQALARNPGSNPRDTGAAQRAMRAAEQEHARVVKRLAAAIWHAAEQADVLRRGLQRRHGGIAEATQSAPVRAAPSGFYR